MPKMMPKNGTCDHELVGQSLARFQMLLVDIEFVKNAQRDEPASQGSDSSNKADQQRTRIHGFAAPNIRKDKSVFCAIAGSTERYDSIPVATTGTLLVVSLLA